MVANTITPASAAPERPAIPDVLEEHLEEIAHLSIQRRKLLFSEIPLRRLKHHAERIEAHLDGLRVAGPAGVKLAEARLETKDPWLASAAARVWIEQEQPASATVLERWEKLPPALLPAWREAFRQLNPEQVKSLLPQQNFEKFSPRALTLAADAWGWHGLMAAQTASKLVASQDPQVRFSLARHAEQPALVAALLNDPDLRVRRAALWRQALQNSRDALSRARQSVRSESPDVFSWRILGLFGERGDGRVMSESLGNPEVAPIVLTALRDLALPEFAERLAGLIEDGEESIAQVVFESLLGRPSPLDPETPLPKGISPALFHWQQSKSRITADSRRLRGQNFPWPGPPTDEPMEMVWRKVLAAPQPELAWLRREVPDGFFNGVPSVSAIPGE